MSLLLSESRPPVEIGFEPRERTGLEHDYIRVGEIQIPTQDFCAAMRHVLTWYILDDNDPRYQLVEQIKSMRVVERPYGKVFEIDPRLSR